MTERNIFVYSSMWIFVGWLNGIRWCGFPEIFGW